MTLASNPASTPTYSFVIPVYNEEDNLPELYAHLKETLAKLEAPAEIILIDDGSRDRSLEQMRQLQASDTRVRYLSLARNFGHQTAVTAGLHFVQGQAIIVMDSDLQDPPELVLELIERWQQGYQVVYAQRISRQQEGWLKRGTAYLFYRILNTLSEVKIPTDTGDFCLMDRQVVDLLNQMPEKNRYIRCLRAWVVFRQTAVKFQRPARFAGEIKYTFRKSLGLAINSILGFSRKPLRLATYLGLMTAVLALIMMRLTLYWRFFAPTSPLVGFT
ncbi:MAG: glycosyltransferase family 2 protein, partial [Thermosynechococcaceae cyanobacterium]